MFNFATKKCHIWCSGRVAGSAAVPLIVFIVRGLFSVRVGEPSGGGLRTHTTQLAFQFSLFLYPPLVFVLVSFLSPLFLLNIDLFAFSLYIRITKQSAIPTIVYAVCRERNVESTIITISPLYSLLELEWFHRFEFYIK